MVKLDKKIKSKTTNITDDNLDTINTTVWEIQDNDLIYTEKMFVYVDVRKGIGINLGETAENSAPKLYLRKGEANRLKQILNGIEFE